MSELIPSSPSPQFQTAEYAGDDRCAYCHLQITGRYFRVNGAMTCAACGEKIKAGAPVDTHGSFARALVVGIGAAIIGMALYSTFAVVTGWVIGYLSLAVGFIIAKAMMKASGGTGGRRYQVVAALLTYAAVSMSAIPVYISQEIKTKKDHQQVVAAQHKAPIEQKQLDQQPESTPQATAPDAKTGIDDDDASASSSDAAATSDTNTPTKASEPKRMSGSEFAKGLVLLALIGLASPFLNLANPLSGFIGLVILFVGIRIAWTITAGTGAPVVEGPL